MKHYLLIGGIGSGKSTVSNLFFEQGAYCIDMDTVGHRQLFDPQVKRELVEAFGEEILDATKHVNRAALARAAFVSEQATAVLNAITHPRILSMVEQRLARAHAAGSQVAIVESSAYAGPEGAGADLFSGYDGVIAVCAPEDVRVARCVARGMDEADVRARMARQPTDEERRNWADFVIENAGTPAALEKQVVALWPQLSL